MSPVQGDRRSSEAERRREAERRGTVLLHPARSRVAVVEVAPRTRSRTPVHAPAAPQSSHHLPAEEQRPRGGQESVSAGARRTGRERVGAVAARLGRMALIIFSRIRARPLCSQPTSWPLSAGRYLERVVAVTRREGS